MVLGIRRLDRVVGDKLIDATYIMQRKYIQVIAKEERASIFSPNHLKS